LVSAIPLSGTEGAGPASADKHPGLVFREQSALIGGADTACTEIEMGGTERAAPASVIASRVEPPFPSGRIVSPVALSAQSGISRLVVTVFGGANPYAYEQDDVTTGAPAAVTFAVEAMSERLQADVGAQAAHAEATRQAGPLNGGSHAAVTQAGF
jgi:hypothetical protein